MEIPHFSDKN